MNLWNTHWSRENETGMYACSEVMFQFEDPKDPPEYNSFFIPGGSFMKVEMPINISGLQIRST
jgi:hypothetical protein